MRKPYKTRVMHLLVEKSDYSSSYKIGNTELACYTDENASNGVLSGNHIIIVELNRFAVVFIRSLTIE